MYYIIAKVFHVMNKKFYIPPSPTVCRLKPGMTPYISGLNSMTLCAHAILYIIR